MLLRTLSNFGRGWWRWGLEGVCPFLLIYTYSCWGNWLNKATIWQGDYGEIQGNKEGLTYVIHWPYKVIRKVPIGSSSKCMEATIIQIVYIREIEDMNDRSNTRNTFQLRWVWTRDQSLSYYGLPW